MVHTEAVCEKRPYDQGKERGWLKDHKDGCQPGREVRFS